MTSLAKLLVLVNLFFAVLIVSWAVSLYVNRPLWLDSENAAGAKVDGRLAELKTEIQEANSRAAAASSLYGSEQRELLSYETLRAQRNQAYAIRLDQARNGLFTEPALEPDGVLIDINKPGKVVTISETDTTPLPGIAKSAEELRTQTSEIHRLIDGVTITPDQWNRLETMMGSTELDNQLAVMGIGDLQKLLEKLSYAIAAKELAVNKQRDLLENLKDESPYLESTQVNWIAQLEALKRRQSQLQNRLSEYNAATQR